jgi:hypothetical protein
VPLGRAAALRLATFRSHGRVTAVAIGEVAGTLGRDLGGEDETIRVWNRQGATVRIVETGSAVRAVALAGSRHIAIATSSGLIHVELAGSRSNTREAGPRGVTVREPECQ